MTGYCLIDTNVIYTLGIEFFWYPIEFELVSQKYLYSVIVRRHHCKHHKTLLCRRAAVFAHSLSSSHSSEYPLLTNSTPHSTLQNVCFLAHWSGFPLQKISSHQPGCQHQQLFSRKELQKATVHCLLSSKQTQLDTYRSTLWSICQINIKIFHTEAATEKNWFFSCFYKSCKNMECIGQS